MSREGIGVRWPTARRQLVARIAVAVAVIGVFSTWASDDPVTLNGAQGPNNGWLVLIASGFALAWTGSLGRESWIGIVGVLGAAVVIVWTAVENWLDNRAVIPASIGYGLVLVTAAGVALGWAAVTTAVERTRVERGASVTHDAALTGPGGPAEPPA